LLAAGGFAGDGLDIVLGVSYGESYDPVTRLRGYVDAVGDLTLVDAKWGPSISHFQIRSLRDPTAWGLTGVWRDAERLHSDPLFATKAAFAISKGGTDFTPWSVYKNGTYLQWKGQDYLLRTGHSRADQWNA